MNKNNIDLEKIEKKIISFYITKKLKDELDLIANKRNAVKSKIIRAAEEVYYNSKLNVDDYKNISIDKKEKKITCAFDKDKLLSRANEKGFKKITDYLNAVLTNNLKKFLK